MGMALVEKKLLIVKKLSKRRENDIDVYETDTTAAPKKGPNGKRHHSIKDGFELIRWLCQ